jgi:hypothetical protein
MMAGMQTVSPEQKEKIRQKIEEALLFTAKAFAEREYLKRYEPSSTAEYTNREFADYIDCNFIFDQLWPNNKFLSAISRTRNWEDELLIDKQTIKGNITVYLNPSEEKQQIRDCYFSNKLESAGPISEKGYWIKFLCIVRDVENSSIPVISILFQNETDLNKCKEQWNTVVIQTFLTFIKKYQKEEHYNQMREWIEKNKRLP